MKSLSQAKEQFNQQLAELSKEVQPAHYGQHLELVVLYEKMLEIQEQLTRLTVKLEKNKELINGI